MDGKEYLTKEKFEELTAELNNLKTVRRKEVAENLEYAKSLGDLFENAEYHEAREQQVHIEERIAKIESILQSAVIVESHHSDMVEVGTTVVVQKEGDTEKRSFEIVSPEEADVLLGKISYRAPLGDAMLGKKMGDNFTFESPNGMMKYIVVEVK